MVVTVVLGGVLIDKEPLETTDLSLCGSMAFLNMLLLG